MILRYMAAHIRNCTGNASAGLWHDQDIVDSFAMLPAPAKTFAEWELLVVGDGEDNSAERQRPAGREALLSDIESIGNIVKIGA